MSYVRTGLQGLGAAPGKPMPPVQARCGQQWKAFHAANPGPHAWARFVAATPGCGKKWRAKHASGALPGYLAALADTCTVDSNGQRVCTSVDTIAPAPAPMPITRRWGWNPPQWNGGGYWNSGLSPASIANPQNLTAAQLMQLQSELTQIQQPLATPATTATASSTVDPSTVNYSGTSSFDFSSIPTWGWIALALGGFMLLRR